MRFKELAYQQPGGGVVTMKNGRAEVNFASGVLIITSPKHLTLGPATPYVIEWAEGRKS